jgi:hypothetical protein
MSNVCQGLPTGPCPDGRQDKTVKYTIYDLFLCPSCERARETIEVEQLRDKRKTNVDNETTKVVTIKRERNKPVSKKPANKASAERKKLVGASGTQDNCATDSLNAASDIAENAADSLTSVDDKDASCPACLLDVDSNSRCIDCDICMSTFHQRCTAMTVKIFDKFIPNVGITGWVCSDCKTLARSSFQRMKQAIAHLAEELADVKQQLCQMKESSKPQADCVLPANTATSARVADGVFMETPVDDEADMKTALIIQRTLSDSSRRKKNIVISGMPENTTSGDRLEFLRLCEEHLSLKPTVAGNGCKRIDKAQTGRPRKLLIRLGSEESVAAVLKSARRLRDSDDEYVANNVFINADLSPAAARLAFEARERRRQRNQHNYHHSTRVLVNSGAETNLLRNAAENANCVATTKPSVAESQATTVKATPAPAMHPETRTNYSSANQAGSDSIPSDARCEFAATTADMRSGNFQPAAVSGPF